MTYDEILSNPPRTAKQFYEEEFDKHESWKRFFPQNAEQQYVIFDLMESYAKEKVQRRSAEFSKLQHQQSKY